MSRMDASLERAKSAVGGNTGLAKRLAERGQQITPQAISQWDRVPAERARDVSELTGVPLHELRPDLWDAPSDAGAGA